MIVEAAIAVSDGKVFTGRRHFEIFPKAIFEGYDLKGENSVQGFLTDEGVFLTREAAYYHAIECGQIKKEDITRGAWLLSEDLW